MKNPLRLFVPLIAFIVIMPFSGYSQEKYSPKPNEEIYGTWTNADQLSYFQKSVNFPGGYKSYWRMADSAPSSEGVEEIVSKWTDSEGNVWYKTYATGISGWQKGNMSQVLMKISKSGTVREFVYAMVTSFDPGDFPTKIDSEDSTYEISYRAKE